MRIAHALALVLAGASLTACGGGRAYEVSRDRLAANHASELAALAPDDAAGAARVERKYALLGAQLEEEASGLTEASPIAYHPLEQQAVQEVMNAFGTLYIGLGTGELKTPSMPWSGYWYPLAGTDLWEAADSPLQKFERAVVRKGRAAGMVAWEKAQHDGVPAHGWEGYCAAWAVASTLTAEPKESLDWEGETFEPKDQKALLTKAHELMPVKRYGIRYDGDQDSDGTFQDIRPEAFHRLVVAHLGERKVPLVVDEDPGIEVWSKPIFRMRWTVTQDPDKPNAFHVAAYPWFVSHRGVESNRPTSDEDIHTAAIEYRLYYDPATRRDDGTYLVIAGEWLGGSRGSHPDYAMVPDRSGGWGSSNPDLNRSLDLVQELFQRGTPHQ